MYKTYRILIEDETLILENTKTNSEGGRFETKIEAFEQIVDMIKEQHISSDHGLELFAEILKAEFVFNKIELTQHPLYNFSELQTKSVLEAGFFYQLPICWHSLTRWKA